MSNKDIQLSKTLSWLLRHAAVKEGLRLSPEGYIAVSELLEHRSLRGKFSQQDVERVVAASDKQRFSIRTNPATSAVEIKANQGHSLPVSEAELTPITEPKYSKVIHGTYLKFWPEIKSKGLSRMERQHIHFAKGEFGDPTVVSGLRRIAEVYIYIDLKKALEDGIKFYESVNGVILSPGNSKGYLDTKYFKKVVKVETGDQIYP